jgi:2-desacetyl-2-hydroxyethyl bacteriochlorophyllide A dehydrogenase
MRALVISGLGEFGLSDRPRPAIGPDDVLLAPTAVGICGTDLELLRGEMVYLRSGLTTLPLIPGHEWVATVVEAGARVTEVSVGDRVVGEVSIGCGECRACRAGTYHQCPNRFETGVARLDGALAGLLAVPARSVHRVPDTVSDDDAFLTEPLAVALRAVLRSEFDGRHPALVTGGGTIGWLIAAVLLETFHIDVAVSEPDPERLERLVGLGARAVEPDEHFETVFEASGSRGGLADSFARLATSGRLVIVGLSGGRAIPVDIDSLVVGDQMVIGSLGSPHVWPEAIELLASGRVRPSLLVSHRFPLDEVETAIETARGGRAGKIMVIPQDAER